MEIKKGDKILIIKGKDRGRAGKVARVMPKKSMVIVDGLNLRKKTTKPRRQGEKGQILTIAWPMRAENVMLICSACGKSTRVSYRNDNGKVRICKKCQAVI